MKTESITDRYHRSIYITVKENTGATINVYQRADMSTLKLLPAEISWYGSSDNNPQNVDAFIRAMQIAAEYQLNWNADSGRLVTDVLEPPHKAY